LSKVWLITGSSRGLGRALAETVLAAGHKLVAAARTPSQLHDLVKRYGNQVIPVALNVTDERAAIKAVKAAIDIFGRLDVLVNNAGYGDIGSIEETSLVDFRAQIETNLFGVINVTRAALPVLREQKSGHIVQISSVGGRLASPGLSAYQTAKWAVEGFSEVFSKEVAPLGIKVTIIEPGGFRTDWAGSSMTIRPNRPKYDSTVGVLAKYIRENHNGVQPGDPVKAAAVIIHITTLDEPPLRLLLGSDAVHIAEQNDSARIEADKKWRDLSVSTNFETGNTHTTYPWERKEATNTFYTHSLVSLNAKNVGSLHT